MKNWEKLEADVNKILTVHYTKGRSGASINKIIVHYNAGNLTTEGCYSVWQSRAASAHYQVEDDGRIGQLVYDSNTAWHASNWQANISSIGIEHANKSDGTITEKCLDNGAHLVAALCKYYKLGRPQWLVNVFPHKYFAATSCPGQIYGSQKSAYIKRAQEWYDYMMGSSSSKPSGSTGSTSSSSGSSSTSKPSTSTSSGKEYTGTGFGGTYTCQVAKLNVRSAPSTSASIVTYYTKGQTVKLDDWYKIADGWVWGRYTGASSGKKRYVAVGKPTGGAAKDDYLIKKGSSTSTSSKKSVETLAQEVINGKWSSGTERKKKLEAAGYDYDAVQKRVNEILSGKSSSSKKSNTTIAKEVIQGKWGTGETRKKKLEAAGYNYNTIQKLVNQML